ncbi:MAG: hypothetical protein ABIP55_00885 [Tepidisphaeraceae bacterium]
MMVTFIRWFEQTAEAVDNRWWNKLSLLLACPFVVWLYPSKVGTGRASPVPHHEPVRGFGSVPKSKSSASVPIGLAEASSPPAVSRDEPPPGTPKEFLGLPNVSPPKRKSSIDPNQIAKLKEKMRQQGMLPPEGE